MTQIMELLFEQQGTTKICVFEGNFKQNYIELSNFELPHFLLKCFEIGIFLGHFVLC